MEYLFVYGSLMKHQDNEMSSFLKKNAEYLDKGYFHGRLFLVDDYPGAVAGNPEDGKVFGHIYQLSEPHKVLPVLDDYEEIGEKFPYPNEYRRESMIVYCHDNTPMTCWVYLYNHPIIDLIQLSSGYFNTNQTK